VKTYPLGGYLGGMAGAFALRGGGMWAWSNIGTSRAVVFPGFYERQKAGYKADTGQLFGEAAYPMQVWGMSLEPFAGLAYVSVNTDNFHERGGSLSSLNGRSTDENVGSPRSACMPPRPCSGAPCRSRRISRRPGSTPSTT